MTDMSHRALTAAFALAVALWTAAIYLMVRFATDLL